jgi:hypothetical protein
MSDGAGFAVALTLRQQLLQNALLIAYANNKFPRTLNTTSLPGGLLPGGPPDAGLNVFLGPPTITSNTGNTLTLALEIWGQISLTMTTVREVAQIDAHLTITIVPAFVVSGTHLELSLTTDNVTVTQWTFTVIPPSSLSTAANAYLNSAAFIARLQTAIQDAIAIGIITLPKIDISFLGSLVTAVNMTAASRARQGGVLIGLNIQSPDLTLIGDVDQLADFAGPNDLAAFINAQAIPLLLQDVQNEIITQVAKNGATLQGKVNIGSGAGKFLISGKASRTGGSANFSFSAVPMLFASEPGAFFQYLKKPFGVKPRTWPALGFAIADVNVDVDPSTWVYVVTAVFTVLNIGVPFFVADFINGISAQLTFAIQSAPTITPVPRVQHLPPTAPGGPVTRVELTAYDISADGTFIGVTVAPQAPPPMLIGLTSIPANFIGQMLNYSVRLPLGVGTDDPALRIRWTVIDPVSGNVLVNQDGLAAGRDTFGFTPATVAPGLAQLRITVRVYRPFGATVTDFVNDGITLTIRGPLPPGAYIRWYYDVKNPNVRFDTTPNTWVYTGDAVVKRHSNYHRTDKPCAMEARRSRYTYRQDLLNTLPFSVSDIALHRAELCDYCFYGGPAGLRPSL